MQKREIAAAGNDEAIIEPSNALLRRRQGPVVAPAQSTARHCQEDLQKRSMRDQPAAAVNYPSGRERRARRG